VVCRWREPVALAMTSPYYMREYVCETDRINDLSGWRTKCDEPHLPSSPGKVKRIC